jgi:hypothetical protein
MRFKGVGLRNEAGTVSHFDHVRGLAAKIAEPLPRSPVPQTRGGVTSSRQTSARMSTDEALTKVPAVTLTFWIIKIAATTLGETGGDTLTMTIGWSYLAGTALFLSLLVVLVIAQIAAKKFHPFLYWATIVASTTAGTTMADFADRSLGVGYTGGSLIPFSVSWPYSRSGMSRSARFRLRP